MPATLGAPSAARQVPANPWFNRNHPLARGLVAAWIASSPYQDLVNGAAVSFPSATGGVSDSGFGTSYLGHGSGKWTYSGTASFLPKVDCTVVVVGRKTGSNIASSSFGDSTGARLGAHFPYSDGVIYFDFEATTVGAGRVTYTPSAAELNEPATWFFTVKSYTTQEIWRNGVRKASVTGPGPRSTNGTWNLFGGNGGTNGESGQNYSAFFVYDRVLSQAEMAALSDAPFQVFTRAHRAVSLAAPVAASSQDIGAATGTITLSGVAGAISPSGGPTIGAATGTITLTGVNGAVTSGATTIGSATGTITLSGVAGATSGSGSVSLGSSTGTITLTGVAGALGNVVPDPVRVDVYVEQVLSVDVSVGG